MNLYPNNEWYRKHLERNFDVVNIGSSSAKSAFDYTGLPLKAFNWAEQPQSLSYSFKVLKTYYSILKKRGVVIIVLCPFSGLDVDGIWRKDTNDKYYYILPHELIDDYPSVVRRRKYPLFFYPKESIKCLVRILLHKQDSNRKVGANHDFEDDSVLWIKLWKDEFGIDSLDAPMSQENIKGQKKRIELLSQILQFCIDRELSPVLVIPPIHHSLADKFSSRFKENYIYSFIRKANTLNVPFMNYMEDERFGADVYFRNSYLMSEEGARLFTKTLLVDLNVL